MNTESIEQQTAESFEIFKDLEIAAPIEIAFEAMLDEMGPDAQGPGPQPFPMKLEPWPGGRWFRDLGNNTGHLWGHVQVIKPPTLLEICGPLMMSYPALNHVQYRFKSEGEITRLTFCHRAHGLIQPQHREGLNEGWQTWLERIRDLAERKQGK